MVSLLARLSLPGQRDPGARPSRHAPVLAAVATAAVTVLSDKRIEVSIAGDRYRLPATVRQ